jgi:hypothetical protein
MKQDKLAAHHKSDYSGAKSVTKSFAPTTIQIDDSLLIFAKMIAIEEIHDG